MNRHWRRRGVLITGAGVIALGAGLWMVSVPRRRLPAISLPGINGHLIHLAAFKGRPLLINFWASTCATCRRELPYLVAAYDALRDNGMEVIGITMSHDPPNRVIELAGQMQIPYPVALDIDGTAAAAFGNVHITPTWILVAADGTIAQQVAGTLDLNALLAKTPELVVKRDAAAVAENG